MIRRNSLGPPTYPADAGRLDRQHQAFHVGVEGPVSVSGASNSVMYSTVPLRSHMSVVGRVASRSVDPSLSLMVASKVRSPAVIVMAVSSRMAPPS